MTTATNDNDVGGLEQSKTQHRDVMGNLVKVIDNMSNEVTYTYDALNNMTSVTSPLLNGSDQDSTGTLPLDAHITTISYDDLGRKSSMSDPNKGHWSYTYNGLDQLVTQTNARGEVTCSVYDEAGRVVRRVDNYAGTIATFVGDDSSDSTNSCANSGDVYDFAEWFYDIAPNMGKGKLWKAFNSSVDTGTSVVGKETTLAYDDTYGLPTSATSIIDGQTYVSSTSYDQYNRAEIATYPSHDGSPLAVKTVYNTLGFPVELRKASNDDLYYALIDQDAYGNVTKEQYGNGVTTLRDFDPRSNRLNSIVSYKLLDLSGPSIQNLDLKFDVVGNLTTRTDHLQGLHETFGYDGLNRLTDMYLTMTDMSLATPVTHPVEHTSVTYDALGNILTKSGVGAYKYGGHQSCAGSTSVQAGPHAVTQISGGSIGLKNAEYCYDANGNMVAGDDRRIDYTYFDKPEFIQKGSFTTALEHDADRNRYSRIDDNDGVLTTYTYLGNYEKVEKVGGVIEERHYIGGFAMAVKTISGGQTDIKNRYLHKDHIGSIAVITDDQLGDIIERQSFDPWGKRRAVAVADLETRLGKILQEMSSFERTSFTLSSLSLASSYTNKGFTGHEQMDGVGLIHMGGRVYDAEIGRFLSADPFVQDRTDLQNLNRYTYVKNNPLSYTDPSGYFFKKLFKKFVKAIKSVVKASFDYFVRRPFELLNSVPYLSTVIGIAVSIGCPPCGAVYFKVLAAANAVYALANGASPFDVAVGFAVGYVSGGLGAGLGGALSNAGLKLAGQYIGAGIAGGIAAKAMGGKFADGFAGGLAGAAVRHAQGEFAAETADAKGKFDHGVSADDRQDNFDKALSLIGDKDDNVKFVDRYAIERSDGEIFFKDSLDGVKQVFANASEQGLKAGFLNGVTRPQQGSGLFGTNLFAKQEVFIYRTGVLPYTGTLAGQSGAFSFTGLERALNTIGHELAHARHGIDYNGSYSHPNATAFGLDQCRSAGYCQ